jgi:tetratricopeptide (TPR) repeat protein
MRHRRFLRSPGREGRLVLAGLWLLVLLILVGCSQLTNLTTKPLPEEIRLGITFLQQNRKERAIGEFEAAVKAQPANAEVYIRIGQVAAHFGHFDIAARYAEQGLTALQNLSADNRIRLSTIASEAYLQRGDSARAVKFAEDAYRSAPDHPHALNLLGYTLAEVYEVDKQPDARPKLVRALELTTKAVSQARGEQADDLTMGMIVDSVGWVHYKLHNYDEAIAHLSRATDLSPRVHQIHYHLALAFQKKQRYAEAITELNRAIQVSPTPYPEAEAALASVRQLLPPSSPVKQTDPPKSSGDSTSTAPRSLIKPPTAR